MRNGVVVKSFLMDVGSGLVMHVGSLSGAVASERITGEWWFGAVW